MKAVLIRHTQDPDGVVALAARLCYSSAGIEDLTRGLSGKDVGNYIRKIVSLGHHSVLEHASFTFGIEGISRAASHQLVRHRLASYSQKSQRYVEEEKPFLYVVPPAIGENEELAAEYAGVMKNLHDFYRRLVKEGVRPEDARYVFPNATETKIIMTMNARELHHFFHLRLCLRAQWEIRQMAEAVLVEVCKVAPRIFEGAGPSCAGGPCPEGDMNCGRIAEMREKYRSRCPE